MNLHLYLSRFLMTTERLSKLIGILLQPFLYKIKMYAREDIHFFKHRTTKNDSNTLMIIFDVIKRYWCATYRTTGFAFCGEDHGIHWVHLCRGIRLSPRVSCYDAKQSDCEAWVLLEFWRMWSTSSVQALPGLLWPWVIPIDRVLSMGQIERNCLITLNWIAWN